MRFGIGLRVGCRELLGEVDKTFFQSYAKFKIFVNV